METIEEIVQQGMLFHKGIIEKDKGRESKFQLRKQEMTKTKPKSRKFFENKRKSLDGV